MGHPPSVTPVRLVHPTVGRGRTTSPSMGHHAAAPGGVLTYGHVHVRTSGLVLRRRKNPLCPHRRLVACIACNCCHRALREGAGGRRHRPTVLNHRSSVGNGWLDIHATSRLQYQ